MLGPPCLHPSPPSDPVPHPQPHMPLLSIYSLALEQDLEFGHGMVQAVGTLQTQTFMQVRGAWMGGLGRGVTRVPTHSPSRPSP